MEREKGGEMNLDEAVERIQAMIRDVEEYDEACTAAGDPILGRQ